MQITTHLAAVAGAALEHQGMVASVHQETVVAEASHMEAVRQKEEVASQASLAAFRAAAFQVASLQDHVK